MIACVANTADVYGPHTNEILIHDALHPYPNELVIATKVGFVRGGYDYSTLGAVGNPHYLRQSAHMSARRLGVEQIDLYYLHSGTATDVPFADQVATLAELREQGLIRNIGLSNVTLEQFHAAREIVEIAAVTAHYNVSVRRGAALLAAAERAGTVFSPWHPVRLNEGPDAPRALELVEEIARRYDATPQQIALAWQLHRSTVTLPIPGAIGPGPGPHTAAARRAAAVQRVPAESRKQNSAASAGAVLQIANCATLRECRPRGRGGASRRFRSSVEALAGQDRRDRVVADVVVRSGAVRTIALGKCDRPAAGAAAWPRGATLSIDGGGARSGSRFASTAAAPGGSSSLAARSRPLVVARSGSGHYMSAESITKALTTPLQEPEDVIGVAHAA